MEQDIENQVVKESPCSKKESRKETFYVQYDDYSAVFSKEMSVPHFDNFRDTLTIRLSKNIDSFNRPLLTKFISREYKNNPLKNEFLRQHYYTYEFSNLNRNGNENDTYWYDFPNNLIYAVERFENDSCMLSGVCIANNNGNIEKDKYIPTRFKKRESKIEDEAISLINFEGYIKRPNGRDNKALKILKFKEGIVIVYFNLDEEQEELNRRRIIIQNHSIQDINSEELDYIICELKSHFSDEFIEEVVKKIEEFKEKIEIQKEIKKDNTFPNLEILLNTSFDNMKSGVLGNKEDFISMLHSEFVRLSSDKIEKDKGPRKVLTNNN